MIPKPFKNNIDVRLDDLIEQNPDIWAADLEKIRTEMIQEGLIYKGEVLKFSEHPFFISSDDETYFSDVCSQWNQYNQELAWLLQNDDSVKGIVFSLFPEIGRMFDYSGDDNPVGVARLDGSMDDEFKLLEFNTNCPGGFLTSDRLERIILENSDIFRVLGKEFELRPGKRVKNYLKLVNERFETFRKAKDIPENMVVIGKKEDGERAEHHQVADLFRELGYQAFVLDHKDNDLIYDGDKLSYRGHQIGLVVRRVIDFRQDLADAVRDGKVLMVNPFMSQVFANKNLTSIAQRPEILKKFSSDSRRFINDYLPLSRVTSDFISRDNIGAIIDEKDRYVIKDPFSNEGKGVYIGQNKSTTEWAQIVGSSMNKSWVLQDFVRMPRYDGRVFDISPICINGEFVSVYGRLSPTPDQLRTNGYLGGYDIPQFFYENE